MCGRFTQAYTWAQVRDAMDLTGPAPNLAPRYNVAPTQDVAIVRVEAGERRLSMVRWGFLPPWAGDAAKAIINARAEGIDEKPTFRDMFRRGRCLIPMDGFYEWTGPKGQKQPYRIVPKGGGIFPVAGLWGYIRTGDDEVACCTVITCAANETMAKLHDRMPVVLPPGCHDAWLDGTAGTEILVPAPEDALEAYPVDRRVGNVKHDDPGLIERVY